MNSLQNQNQKIDPTPRNLYRNQTKKKHEFLVIHSRNQSLQDLNQKSKRGSKQEIYSRQQAASRMNNQNSAIKKRFCRLLYYTKH